MNKKTIQMLPLLTLLAIPVSGQTIAGYEYWFDDGYAGRTEVRDAGGDIRHEIDVSALTPGMHRFMFRVEDTEGRWSNTLCKQFVYFGPSYGDKSVTRYELWLDDNVESRMSGDVTGGAIQMEIDAAGLSCGLHRVVLRAQDAAGRWSMAKVHNFVKPEPSLAGNMISSYEYWFNRGAVTRVEVGPANPFTVDDR